MNIALLQVATLLGQPQKNRVRLESLIHEIMAQKVDVLMFPETWNVGFFPENIEEVTQSVEQNECLEWMKATAKKHQVHIVGGSIALEDQGKLYNRAYVINREGQIVYAYDKAHLFSPGKEPDFFTPGAENHLFELDGVKCGIQICYDLRFPELARKQAVSGAQVIFIPAQWPHPRSKHWVTLNQARAIENQVFIVANNGCGKAGNVVSCGHSTVVDPWGEQLLVAGEEEGVHLVSLQLEKVNEVRSKIPVFQDRLPSLYQ
ncbi:carbon-nitrogen family hydrolase [Caldalkalibacillus mannanilyticus]|uniref:carbon-nitrogen family hydrolase n=1 Tax=Caldalkalibacillus mannanilyticus TaxID=1418 RepID=UPI00046905F6|nr:carbon-nitrogen family hydrolase [Caldalkalibacillus mannanilyticus]